MLLLPATRARTAAVISSVETTPVVGRSKAAAAGMRLAAGSVGTDRGGKLEASASVRVAAGLVAACLVSRVMVKGGVEGVTTVAGGL